MAAQPSEGGDARAPKRRASYTWKGPGGPKRFRGPPRDTPEEAKHDEDMFRSKLEHVLGLRDATETHQAVLNNLKEEMCTPSALPDVTGDAERGRKRRASYTWKSVDGERQRRYQGPSRNTRQEADADYTRIRSQLGNMLTAEEADRTFQSLLKDMRTEIAPRQSAADDVGSDAYALHTTHQHTTKPVIW